MFPSVSTFSALGVAGLFAFASQSDARPIPHSVRLYRRFTFVAQPAPDSWATTLLEDYDTYHFRYLAVSCHTQHSSTFFTECCHPRRKSQSDADFPAQCSLSASSVAAAADIVEASTGKSGAVKAGKEGKAVFVQGVEALVAVKVNGKDSTRPPTKNQLAAIAKAQVALTASKVSSTSVSSIATPTTTFAKQVKPTPNAIAASAAAQKQQQQQQQQQQAAAAASASSASAAAAKASQQADADAQAAAASASASKASAAAQAQATKDSSSGSSSSSSGSSGSSGSSLTGDAGLLADVEQLFGANGDAHATFFLQNGVAGACGTVHSDSTLLIALETTLYANGAHCGQEVVIKNTATGAFVTATVQDECPTCTTSESIDLSVAAFNAIGPESEGVLPIEWGFVSS